MEQGLFCDDVTLLDFAYVDRKFSVHGESYRVDVELMGDINSEAMILDFSQVKHQIKKIIDERCDHRLVVHQELVDIKNNIGTINKQALRYRAPLEAFCLVPFETLTKEKLANFLEEILVKEMPSNVSSLRVRLREHDGNHTTFQYTHGLKQHKGNCQRLLHGHRSMVEIFIDGKRERELEKKFIAKFLGDSVHFAFSENVKQSVELCEFQTQMPMLELGYKSTQGDFHVSLPGVQVWVLPEETTIENIAKYLCSKVFEMVDQNCTVTLKAYEGLGKGGKVTLSSPL